MHETGIVPGEFDVDPETSISTAVQLSVEGLHYILRRGYSQKRSERAYCTKLARHCFQRSLDGMIETKQDDPLMLNANRDSKRGRVLTLGRLAETRFLQHEVPQIVLRISPEETTNMMNEVCSELYHSGVHIAPVARISQNLLVSLFMGQNLMQVLGTYEDDRGRVEIRLWRDMLELSDDLASRIPDIVDLRRHYVEDPTPLYTALQTMESRYNRSLRREIKQNVRILRAEPVWPFLDLTWRNLGVDSIDAYARGEGRLILYDPDRFDRRSSQSFNLAHISCMPWKTIPLQERLGILPNLDGPFHYLARRVARAHQFKVPKTASISQEVENEALKQERADLLELIKIPELRSRYPTMCGIFTDAASTWDL